MSYELLLMPAQSLLCTHGCDKNQRMLGFLMKDLRGRCSEGRLLGVTNSGTLILLKSANHTHHIAATCEGQVL